MVHKIVYNTQHARVVKWYTRTLEVRMPQGVEVQLLSRAPIEINYMYTTENRKQAPPFFKAQKRREFFAKRDESITYIFGWPTYVSRNQVRNEDHSSTFTTPAIIE